MRGIDDSPDAPRPSGSAGWLLPLHSLHPPRPGKACLAGHGRIWGICAFLRRAFSQPTCHIRRSGCCQLLRVCWERRCISCQDSLNVSFCILFTLGVVSFPFLIMNTAHALRLPRCGSATKCWMLSSYGNCRGFPRLLCDISQHSSVTFPGGWSRGCSTISEDLPLFPAPSLQIASIFYFASRIAVKAFLAPF